MAIQIGQQLGSLEITALLGKGGMGEVYRARDTKLKREVAIKILPEEFSRDPDRVARFQREAEVLASLNHPNIAAIYDLEEANDTRFLVMELVEGDTLADRIQRGPIRVDEALTFAKSICEALEAAHEQGIVHRDLKPANIKITPRGVVKVLDFGLAKVREGSGPPMCLSNSPTLLSGSRPGVIMGTAAYMSPEQAKGRPIDRRTDIFAFGCVLYEMLTGKPAFDGEDTTEILSKVLQRDPDWKLLAASVPARIGELLRLCLQKDVRKRRSDAADVRIDIEQALSDSTVEAVYDRPASARDRLGWIAAAVFFIGMGALAIVHFRETPPAAQPEIRTDIVTPGTADPVSFALSPDGRQIVFVASEDNQRRLWVRPLDKETAQPLAGTEGASYPFWSPDSRSIGFFDTSGLKRIDLAGGSSQTLAYVSTGGATWSESGIILFAGNATPLYRITASGGERLAVTKFEKGQISHRFPQFLPGGRQFLFYVLGGGGGIYLGSLDAPETKRLTAADSAGFYAPQGWLLFIRAGTLLAQRLDLARRELTGDLVTLADPVVFNGAGALTGARAVSVSATGVIAYRGGAAARRTQLSWFDRSGKPLGTFGAPDENNLSNPRLSPDGQRVAVHRTVQGNTDIWILDGDRTTRFTFDAKADTVPVWSPDGNRIVFVSARKGQGNLYVKPSSGASSEELLLESAQTSTPMDWSPDGRFITYITNAPQELWVLPLESDRKPFLFLKTSFRERRGTFSPDGHWMAYMSDESGRDEIYVRPFPGPGGQWQVSTAGGTSPRWAPGGKELYYIAPDGTLMAAPIALRGSSIEPGRPVALFHARILGGGAETVGTQYDVARDGRFLINTVLEDTATSPITLLQNWKPTAK
jgi:serine/threonine protein kinase